MSAGLILCIVLFVMWVASHADIARQRRRERRREFEHTDTVTRAKRQMTRELQPSYPPPPVMPSEDMQ